MKTLSVIFAAILVFALAGCAKVNLPKASPGMADMAGNFAEFVTENGVPDTDCAGYKNCYKFNDEGTTVIEGAGMLMASLEAKVKTKKFKKEMTISEVVTVVAPTGEKTVITWNVWDKKIDGVADKMTDVMQEDGQVVFAINYDKGAITVTGFAADFIKKDVTPGKLQRMYEEMLAVLMKDVERGALKSNAGEDAVQEDAAQEQSQDLYSEMSRVLMKNFVREALEISK
jgi:hypothetical protein